MSARWLMVLFMLSMAVALGGCASDGEIDELWRQGYGFNNPNAPGAKSK